MTKVSVIIPVYRVEKFIRSTIQSVLDQTFTDFELILVDDGSPDNSRGVCESFLDPRIKIISQVNRGLSGARNTGIRNAKGGIIAFLDGDDLWTNNKLEKHLAHLQNSPDVGVSFSRSEFINERGESLGTYQMPKLINITTSHLLFQNPVGNGSAPVLRREVLDSIGFENQTDSSLETWYFDENLQRSEDIDCWLRIATLTSWKIEGISDALTLYRVNSKGLSADLYKQLYSWEQVMNKAQVYAPVLICECISLARACQLRYLARQALRLRDGNAAVEFINRSLSTNWRIALKEPRRTILTAVASYLLKYLPSDSYSKFEKGILDFTARLR
jgi:glycosyltransferase involved in cell wall biosynthesis